MLSPASSREQAMLNLTFAYVMPASSNAFAPAETARLEMSCCVPDEIPMPAMWARDRDIDVDISTGEFDQWRRRSTLDFLFANSPGR
jgi:hypothetical protein